MYMEFYKKLLNRIENYGCISGVYLFYNFVVTVDYFFADYIYDQFHQTGTIWCSNITVDNDLLD